jgi:hypothetical protein
MMLMHVSKLMVESVPFSAERDMSYSQISRRTLTFEISGSDQPFNYVAQVRAEIVAARPYLVDGDFCAADVEKDDGSLGIDVRCPNPFKLSSDMLMICTVHPLDERDDVYILVDHLIASSMITLTRAVSAHDLVASKLPLSGAALLSLS